MADIQALEDQIVNLSLLDAAALVKKLEERLGVVHAALQRVVVGQPEATREADSLAGLETVHARAGVVTTHEPVVQEVSFDGRHGAGDPGILAMQEADKRNHEQARIEPVATIALHETLPLFVVSIAAN